MSDREQVGMDDDGSDSDAVDTGLFDVDQIVSDFESQGSDEFKAKSASSWQRVEHLLERKRLRESLRDLYDDDFLDDE